MAGNPEPPRLKKPKMEDFELARLGRQAYFVDRTGLIPEVLASIEHSVKKGLFISAPYSFGKSTNLRMLKSFLQNSEQFENFGKVYKEEHGEELEIMKDSNRECREEHMGQYLVLEFNFKGFKASSQEEAERNIIRVARKAFLEHESLLEDSKDAFVREIKKIDGFKDQSNLCKYIGSSLIMELVECYEKQNKETKSCFVLIDEFDAIAESLLSTNFDRNKIKEVVHPYDTFVTKIFEAKGLAGCLLTGRTRFGFASTGSIKLGEKSVLNFLEYSSIATYYGIEEEQVRKLLSRDKVLAHWLTEWLKKEKSCTLENAEKLYAVLKEKKYDESEWRKILQDEGYGDLTDQLQTLKKQPDLWFDEMKIGFNGFMSAKKSFFAFSSVIRCLEKGEINYDWEVGTPFEAFSTGLLPSNFGNDIVKSVFGKGLPTDEFLKCPSQTKIKLDNLVDLRKALESHDVKSEGVAFNMYKQYMLDLGILAKYEDGSLCVPNNEILDRICRTMDFKNFCSEDGLIELRTSIECLLESDQLEASLCQQFLRALSLVCSKEFPKYSAYDRKFYEVHLQTFLYYVLRRCFRTANFLTVEDRIPQHVLDGYQFCPHMQNGECCCDGRTAKRADMVLISGDKLVFFEFKVDAASAVVALKCIRDRQYYKIEELYKLKNISKCFAIAINYKRSSDKFSAGFIPNASSVESYEEVVIHDCNKMVKEYNAPV